MIVCPVINVGFFCCFFAAIDMTWILSTAFFCVYHCLNCRHGTEMIQDLFWDGLDKFVNTFHFDIEDTNKWDVSN